MTRSHSKKGNSGAEGSDTIFANRFLRSKEDIQFAVTIACILSAVIFSYLSFRIWSSLQGPRIDAKLTKAQQAALLAKWEPFSLPVFFDGQLGASLFGLALASWYAASSWVRDRSKLLVAAAAFLGVHALLTLNIWFPFAAVLGGVFVYLAAIYSSPPMGKNDHLDAVNATTPRILFVVDASLILYGEILRLQTPDIPVGADAPPPAVDPNMHRAAHVATIVLLLFVVVGKDVHAYRTMLKLGAWIWFSALCPLLGVYDGGQTKKILAVIAAALCAAHVGLHLTFPFNTPIVQFIRKYRSDMKRVVSGAGDE